LTDDPGSLSPRGLPPSEASAVSVPTRPPPGFIVSASGVFEGEGERRFERGVRMLLWSLARNASIGPIVMGLIASTAGRDRHVLVVPDRAPCGRWTRNDHAQPFSVSGVDIGARVLYTPRCWERGGIFDARVVLFHELTHALRHLTGSWTGASRSDCYRNVEEFHSTTLSNVLRSELGLPLRLGYTFGDRTFEDLLARIRREAASVEPSVTTTGSGMTFRDSGSRTFQDDTVLNPPPTERQLRDFSADFAGRHPAVAGLFNETGSLARQIASVPWSSAPFNPYRASGG